MWAYIPASTVSRLALEEGDSTLDSHLLVQAFTLSFTWRGKHTPSADWSRRLKKVAWLRRLSGLILPPSTADRGAALWMAYLAESRAPDTAWRESVSGASTSAMDGPTPAGSSPKRARGSSSSKMLAECSAPERTGSRGPIGSDETYSAWASRLREDYLRRQKSAGRTSGNASSFSGSAWPTPRASEAGADFAKMDRSDTGMALPAVAVISTQRASAWPTPAARDGKGVDRTEIDRGNARPLNEVAAAWSTPRASDGEKGSPNQSFGAGGVPLPSQPVTAAGAMWQTPRTVMGAYTRDNGDPEKERLSLDGQARSGMWQSPTVGDVTGGHTSRSAERQGEPLLNAQAKTVAQIGASHRPDPTTSIAGAPSSPNDLTSPQLSPAFVAWLMAWTLPASTNYGFWEMGSIPWRQAMRSALLRLGLPPEAPKVQGDLFA